MQRPTSSKLPVDEAVADNRQASVAQRVGDRLAVQVAIAVVIRVDGDRGVTEERLGSRRRHDDLTVW